MDNWAPAVGLAVIVVVALFSFWGARKARRLDEQDFRRRCAIATAATHSGRDTLYLLQNFPGCLK